MQDNNNSDEFIRVLHRSISYVKPLSVDVVLDAMEKLPLTGENLQDIYEIATQGAVNQYSRGFHQEALQYIAIAARAKKEILLRN